MDWVLEYYTLLFFVVLGFHYSYFYPKSIYIYIYIWTPPPPLRQTLEAHSSLPRKGAEDQHSKIPRVSKNPKTQKIHPKGLEFWKLEEFPQNPKNEQIPRVSKVPKSKKPTPRFGILETRGISSESKKRANSSSFQNSKNPKNPPQGLEFWKLEEFARFLDFEAPARVSKIPNLWGGSFGFLEF